MKNRSTRDLSLLAIKKQFAKKEPIAFFLHPPKKIKDIRV